MTITTPEPIIPPAADLAALDALCAAWDVPSSRHATLLRAIALGAGAGALHRLAQAIRVKQGKTIVLPPHRYEGLSRGRGWCRMGRGSSVEWGEREDKGGYRVGPGVWTIGATDGFARKGDDRWTVEHLPVGAETWTIAD